MGGNTGNIRGQRNQSSSNGFKTLGSILASDSGNGAGSYRRLYAYYAKNGNISAFYNNALNLSYGDYKDRSQWVLGI